MGEEVEAKIPVSELEPTRRRLEELGGTLLRDGPERNVVFDTSDARLRKTGRLLRLRRYGAVILTYKGPIERAESGVKSRREIEVEVSDFDDAALLLESLGFGAVWTYEKQREEWSWGERKVVLDRLPHLGTFVEVEGPCGKDVMEAVEALGLPAGDVTAKTYLELFDEYRRNKGLDSTDMVFECREES